MFIPRLRHISDVIKEIRKADPNTAITYYALKRLILDNKFMTIKYGNAWLINLDKLYAFFTTNGGKENETTNENDGTHSANIL